ncbi:hypothetical protein C8R45DRAFT_1174840 [Mycena sanguinolenta]|nr:hypothetical protein C8R45DRAFT_1174840 [Mycena sanguinolenta]
MSLPAFLQVVQECSRLVYLDAQVCEGNHNLFNGVAETHSSLRKLVLRGSRSQQAFVAHRFPCLLSLSVEMNQLHPHFFQKLMRSSHLEFLCMWSGDCDFQDDLAAYCWRPPAELLRATPSLRIILIIIHRPPYCPDRCDGNHEGHFGTRVSVALATPSFYTPLADPRIDVPFPSVAPRSLADADVATLRRACTKFDQDELLVFVKARMEGDTSFDLYGIERARLINPLGEDELDYLDYL